MKIKAHITQPVTADIEIELSVGELVEAKPLIDVIVKLLPKKGA